MKNICTSVENLIGNTPLIELTHIENELGDGHHIYAKLERQNPGGSAKDRVAKNIIDDAVKNGSLEPGGTIIEPTSGNTGIGLAMLAAAMGYKAIIVMPDTMSRERQLLMKAYGAQLVLSDGSKGMAGAIELAEAIHNETPGSIIAGQFTNEANSDAHYKTTGPEIWADADGEIDTFIAGIGTGGTISGTGRYLKEQAQIAGKSIKIIGIEPAGSPFLTKGEAGAHDLQGIGAGFKPDILDMDVIDEVMTITDEEAYECGRMLAREEGLLCGITSGAALAAALKLKDAKDIVILLPDTGERYLSTKMFEA